MKINALNIRNLMLKLNVKQKDLAEQIGMSGAAFSGALRRGGISDDRVTELARILQTDTDTITGVKILSPLQNEKVHEPEQGFFHDAKTHGREMLVCHPKTIVHLKQEIIDLMDKKMQDLQASMKIAEESIKLASVAMERMEKLDPPTNTGRSKRKKS